MPAPQTQQAGSKAPYWYGLTRRLRPWLVSASLSGVLLGCAGQPTHPPQSTYNANYRAVAISVSQQAPEIDIHPLLSGDVGKATGQGAAVGAGAGIFRCLEVPFPPLLAICGALGATVGGVISHVEASTAARQQFVIDRLLKSSKAAGTTELILHKASAYAQSQGVPLASRTDDADTQVIIQLKKVSFQTAGGIKLPGSILLEFSGRLSRNGDLVDSFTTTKRINWEDIRHLQGGRLEMLIRDIDQQITEAVHDFIEEFLLIYHPPPNSGYEEALRDPGMPATAPPYALRPIQPPSSGEQVWVPLAFPPLSSVESLQPTLRWETFPRPWDLPDRVPGRFSDIRYDLRIYTEARQLIYERSGLPSAQHTVEVPLRPCSTYAWSFRARFMLDGKPRVTEWAGLYDKIPLFPEYPWRIRRGALPITNSYARIEHYAPGFRTPASSPGRACPSP